jgi:protease I
MQDAVVTPDITIQDAKAGDFDAVLLVGGTGSSSLWHNGAVHSLLNESSSSGKIVAAICLAPVTMANAGLLEGKTATAYPSAGDFLTWKGATYTNTSVVRAGNIITANGPEAAEEFARMLEQALTERSSIDRG